MGSLCFWGEESVEFDFSGTLKQSEDNCWVELLVPGLKYENSRGTWSTDSLKIFHDYTGRVQFHSIAIGCGGRDDGRFLPFLGSDGFVE